jgi:hypothetical protein
MFDFVCGLFACDVRPPFEICFEKYFLKMRPRKKCSLRAELSELKIWRAKRAKFFEIRGLFLVDFCDKSKILKNFCVGCG